MEIDININQYDNLYFIGAGGIGMAALERYFRMNGKRIAGHDRQISNLTEDLISEGIELVYEDDPAYIPDYCSNPDNTLVVITAAIKEENHCELRDYFRKHGFRIVKRAKLLGVVTAHSKALCFSGTHGKTTTTSMAAHIMEVSGVGSNAFVGGEMKNYDTNCLLSETSPYSVVEADEYDRSFHQLHPYVAVVTSTDHDHTDIYEHEEDYLEAFARFTELIHPEGTLIVHTGLKLKPRPQEGVKVYTYGRNDGDFHATNIRKQGFKITFDFKTPWETIKDINLGVPVDINIENAIAAMAACRVVGISNDVLRKAISSFEGTKRRFDFWIKPDDGDGRVMVDDYAHHPDELKASINSIRDLFPDRKLTVIFQPHLYTRTRDCASGFATSLSLADEVVLLPIYPAREAPILGVNSEMIFSKINCSKKMCISPKEYLIESVDFSNFDVLLTAGAGDINTLLSQICDKHKQAKR